MSCSMLRLWVIVGLATSLTACEQRGRQDPQEHLACQEVSIDAIYADPISYNEQVVCTVGTLSITDTGIAIHPHDRSGSDLYDVRIRPPISFDEARQAELQIGRSSSSEVENPHITLTEIDRARKRAIFDAATWIGRADVSPSAYEIAVAYVLDKRTGETLTLEGTRREWHQVSDIRYYFQNGPAGFEFRFREPLVSSIHVLLATAPPSQPRRRPACCPPGRTAGAIK